MHDSLWELVLSFHSMGLGIASGLVAKAFFFFFNQLSLHLIFYLI